MKSLSFQQYFNLALHSIPHFVETFSEKVFIFADVNQNVLEILTLAYPTSMSNYLKCRSTQFWSDEVAQNWKLLDRNLSTKFWIIWCSGPSKTKKVPDDRISTFGTILNAPRSRLSSRLRLCAILWKKETSSVFFGRSQKEINIWTATFLSGIFPSKNSIPFSKFIYFQVIHRNSEEL